MFSFTGSNNLGGNGAAPRKKSQQELDNEIVLLDYPKFNVENSEDGIGASSTGLDSFSTSNSYVTLA